MERTRRLFETETNGGRAVYRHHAVTVAAGILLVLYYRATRVPAAGEGRRRGWACWRRSSGTPPTGPSRSPCAGAPSAAAPTGTGSPPDPHSEPPSLVISTILSLMAYNYPAEKISVYLSDDGGSILTFYALWEASLFAKHWIPFCKRYNIEPRSPAAYFSESDGHQDLCSPKEWSLIREMYEDITQRIDRAVLSGKISEEVKANHKGFHEWDQENTSKNHQPIVQILMEGKDKNANDDEGNVLPTLVYMAREKRPQHHHNFKAGAMNALIRVSSVISNSPIIMNVDCDMYSNNCDTIRDALCFFLDEEMGHKIGFVQFPQNYNNLTKNNIYGNSHQVTNQVLMGGMDSVGGPMYVGTGCFHRREILCGRRFTEDYKEDWNGGIKDKTQESIVEIEEKAKSLAALIPPFHNYCRGRRE
ncbi:hypothetical protein VPH35_090696 [Triticum aestivum]